MRKVLALLGLTLGFTLLTPLPVVDMTAASNTTLLPRRPIVAIVAADNAAVNTSISDWSINRSPVLLHLSPSCIGYGHCVTVNYDPYYFQNTGNYGVASGVGDSIRGTCAVTVTMLDERLLDHEFGHCLGLWHTTADTKSIVYIGGSGPYTGNNTPDGADFRNAKLAWSTL